mmetsp:Transcript_33844/g.82039  ORF Transcript_33844/g.82039 Transcript_33844/m.82039 type:complete len:313 (-) Transcript_33844:70-1008(-)
MDRIIIAVNAILFAIVQSIFELANDIHENVQKHSSLLDGFFTASERVLGEISITIVEVGGSSIQSSSNPLVGIVFGTVVAVEIHVISVRASWTVVAHLVSRLSGESSNRTSIVVVGVGIVGVKIVGSFNVDVTTCGKASIKISSFSKSSNLAVDVTRLNISGTVLESDCSFSSLVGSIGNSSNVSSLRILSNDCLSFIDRSWESRGKGDFSIRLGVGTLVVDSLGKFVRIIGGLGKLRLNGSLIKINSTVIGHLRSRCVSCDLFKRKASAFCGANIVSIDQREDGKCQKREFHVVVLKIQKDENMTTAVDER